MKNKKTQASIFTEALSGAAADMAKEMGYKKTGKKNVSVFVKQENTLSKVIGFIKSKKIQ